MHVHPVQVAREPFTHIAVVSDGLAHGPTLEFHVGTAEEFAAMEHKPVRVVAMPKRYLDVFHQKLQPDRANGKRLGYITYSISGSPPNRKAVSTLYSPKGRLHDAKTPRLGYFLEKLAVEHLKTLGVTQVSTGSDANLARRRQLRAVRLRARTTFHVDDWIAGMDDGRQHHSTPWARLKTKFWRAFERYLS